MSSIKTFHYFYTSGYMMNADTSYDLDCTDKCQIKVKEYGKSQEEALTMVVSKEFVEKLETILKDNKVNKWDGFDKVDKNVLDGDSFSLNITFNNGKSISASGYMKYPKNYGEVKSQIEGLFMDPFIEK